MVKKWFILVKWAILISPHIMIKRGEKDSESVIINGRILLSTVQHGLVIIYYGNYSSEYSSNNLISPVLIEVSESDVSELSITGL